MKPTLKSPGTERLKLKCDMLLSTSAFKFNLRRYIKVKIVGGGHKAITGGGWRVDKLANRVTFSRQAGAYTRSLFGSS